MASQHGTTTRVLVALLLAGVAIFVAACGGHFVQTSGALPPVTSTVTTPSSKSTYTYAEDPRVQAIANQWGTTLYVPVAAAGSPPIAGIQTIVPPPIPGVPYSKTMHEQIAFGDQYSEIVSSAPLTLPVSPRDGQDFQITVGAETVKAIAYKASWGYGDQVGNFVNYGVILNVGKVASSSIPPGTTKAI